MSVYPDKLRRLLENIGSNSEYVPNAIGRAANFVCGCSIEVGIEIANGLIADGQVRSNGCGYMIAGGQAMMEHLKGRELKSLAGLSDEMLISAAAGEIGEIGSRHQCSKVAADAVRLAFLKLRESTILEYAGDTALICTCFGVSEETIADVVSTNGLTRVDEVSEICGAGSGCGSCQPLIQEIIDSVGAERL